MMNSYSIYYSSYLGENCNIVSFSGYYYTIQNDTLAPITLPMNMGGMNRMKSESMTYMFSDYSLYKYSALSNDTFPSLTYPTSIDMSFILIKTESLLLQHPITMITQQEVKF